MYRQSAIYFGLLLFTMMAIANARTIDEMIWDATETVQQFAFIQGDMENGMENATITVEMDMVFTQAQWDELQQEKETSGDRSGRQRRKARRNTKYLWTGNVVPYESAPDDFTKDQTRQIDLALDEWNNYTCLTFRPARESDRNKIRFASGRGCSSYVGMIGGAQKVTLATGCRIKEIVVHELGHAVGFKHEQTRPDRDDFVTIVRENIPEHIYHNFQKYNVRFFEDFDVPYDYRSVMHYGPKAFSVNGDYTIRTMDPQYQNVIGEGKGLSFRDIKLANIMYSCNVNCTKKTCPGEGFVDKSCKCMCPGNPIKECSEECADQHSLCQTWASQGACSQYKFYMSYYCKKSCKTCSKVNICEDMAEHCDHWGKKGYCTNWFVSYMHRNCAKTCNSCADSELTNRADSDQNDDVSPGVTSSVDQNDDASAGVTSRPGMYSFLAMFVACVLMY